MTAQPEHPWVSRSTIARERAEAARAHYLRKCQAKRDRAMLDLEMPRRGAAVIAVDDRMRIAWHIWELERGRRGA